MDDGSTAKAPVTRLRRRLSVEAEEVKSPAVTTPTKKRGGRLAAKPQLDLIDENATEETPTKRTTRKTSAKPADEAPLTPARRSARIKSNPSIISETTINYDSPRAKRAAARRSSLAGSDNETTSSPARQTKRTRKDSTSSIDKQVETTSITKTPNISQPIIEEIETNNDDTEAKLNTRRSPRLFEKKGKDNILDKSNINISDIEGKGNGLSDEHNENPIILEEDTQVIVSTSTENSIKHNNELNTTIKDKEQSTINNSCDNLLIDLNEKPQKTASLKNKSCTALDSSNNFPDKRNRTKSWTSVSVDNSKYDNFHSDNEISKKKKKNNSKTAKITGSDDNEITAKKSEKNKSVDKVKSFTDESMTGYKNYDSPRNVKCNHNASFGSSKKTDTHKTTEKDILSVSRDIADRDSITELFNNDPGTHIRSLVFLDEDSNSNADIVSKHRESEVQDQCVPIVHQIHDSDGLKRDISCEPMDIDETLPENISTNNLRENNLTGVSSNTPMCRSNSEKENREFINSVNKSTRKYSGTNLESQNLEKTNNENKSTLILSQIKDTSTNEINTSTKNSTFNNNNQMSKSLSVSDTAVNKESNKINTSQKYLTSTPLQQKLFTKLGIQLDTSLISPKNVSNEHIDTKSSLKDRHISETESHELIDNNEEAQEIDLMSKSNDDSEQSTSEEECEVGTSGQNKNSMIDNEVEEASDDYESGDSQNEEDREYEKNNEIPEKGETLNSEEDFSDDSDYEKDSFVVSSAEEDHELLSGSGDNLSMSDNELNMSLKSKTKYNKRKVKEQKKASREMYNARHGLNESQSEDDKPKIRKIKRQRLNSSALKSDNEEIKSEENSKKTNQGSGTECDLNDISDKKKKKGKSSSESVERPETEKEKKSDEVSVRKKKKVKSLSESMCEEEPENEKEITMFNTSTTGKIDPLLIEIKDEIQSPQKNFNISSVLVNDAVEEVNVNENITVTNLSESLDPLRDTAGVDDEAYSSHSENEEILENYNSILKNLNKNTKKIKSIDISLNEGKQKKKKRVPIVDELNLTLTKTKKSKPISIENAKQANEMLQSECANNSDKSIVQNEDDQGSDSIDMRLLFPEDSNDSEHNSDKLKEGTKIVSPSLDYIPLKGAEVKTNRTSMGNESNDHVPFFIDTKGTRDEDASDDITSKRSAKKSKGKNNTADLSTNKSETEEFTCTSEKKKKNKLSSYTSADNSENLAQESFEMNISSSGRKNKKTKLSLSSSIDENSLHIDLEALDDAPVDIKDVTQSDKKKKKHSKKHTEYSDDANTEVQTLELMSEQPLLESTSSAKKKKKKPKQSLNLSSAEFVETDLLELNDATDEVLYHSKKKKKHSVDNVQRNFEMDTLQAENTDLNEAPANISSCKKKKESKMLQHSLSKSLTNTENEDDPDSEGAPEEVLYRSDKKNKHSIDNHQSNIEPDTMQSENVAPNEAPANVSSGKKKKKTKILQDNFSKASANTEKGDEINNEVQPDEILHHSNKKNKHPAVKHESYIEDETRQLDNTAPPEDAPTNTSSGKKNKKSQILQDNLNKSSTNTGQQDDLVTEEAAHKIHKKKKRAKEFVDIVADNVETNINQLEEAPDVGVNKDALTSKKRKRKALPEVVEVENNPTSENTLNLFEGNENKKRKTIQNNEDITGVTEKKYKKRKERDNEDSTKVSKVFKQTSTDKVYIQRLPSHILTQLEDKPMNKTTENKQPKVLSTTDFMVEDHRRAKRRNIPSKYMEESIYIDDTPVLKKEKKKIKKPKVLPFIPTASTSDVGFTTNFRINVLPGDNQFIAQSTNVTDFRTESLVESKLKKFRNFEKYKNQRKYKISKF